MKQKMIKLKKEVSNSQQFLQNITLNSQDLIEHLDKNSAKIN